MKNKKLKECYGCGLFLEIEENDKEILKCPRCYSKIDIKTHSKESFIYAISALLLFTTCLFYPLLTTNINGVQFEASLFQTPIILFKEHFYIIGFLVFFTLIFAPVVNSIIIIFIFLAKQNKINKLFLYKLFHTTKEWGFIDVFIIGCIVSYIKLNNTFTNTHFKEGFIIMIIYVILFYLSNQKFDSKEIFK